MTAKHHVHRRAAHHLHNAEQHAKAPRGLLKDIGSALGLTDDTPQDTDQQDGALTSTVYVYYTAPATFTEPTAGYVTQSIDDTQATSAETPVAATKATVASSVATSIVVATSKTAVSKSVASTITSASSTKTTATPTAILPGSSKSVPTTLLVASQTQIEAQASATTLQTTATPTATSTANQGLSTGGKAGIAIGVIVGLAMVGSLIFFFIRKRREAAEHERLQDEKSFSENAALAGRSASTRTAPRAPRLSLRPVSNFTNNLLGGAAAGAAAGYAGHNIAMSEKVNNAAPASPWDRPGTSASQDANNPFGNHAELDAHNAAGAPVIATGPGGEYSLNRAAELAGTAAAAAAAAGAGLTRGASKRGNGPANLDLTRAGDRSTSPTGTDYSGHSAASGTPVQTNGAAAIAAMGGPATSAVHRVQLDFKPSMDDELGLRAGQLVRLLHEYDDGWAMCIRLDRSQQGVCPRTCLSTRPVKPRPNGPPPSQSTNQQGQPFRGQGPPRPGSANGMRGQQGPPRPGSAQSNRGPGPQFRGQGPPRPGSANGQYRGPGPAYARPGSAQSNRGPGPMRPGSANGMRNGPGGMYRPDNGPRPQSPAMQRGPRPESPVVQRAPRPETPTQTSSRDTSSSPPRSQQPQSELSLPSEDDLNVPATEHKMKPSPMELVKKWQQDEGKTVVSETSSARSRPASPSAMVTQADAIRDNQEQMPGHKVKASVDRKPVPGMAL